jgi:uncharacterized protein YgfB (UPF0149 family)
LEKLTAAIATLELGVDAAELHGGICGLLCTRGPGAVATWIRESGADHVPRLGDAMAAAERLHEAEAESWRELNGPNIVFYPLLPDAEGVLAERVAGLALWCQGFVTGLGLGGYSLEDAAFEDDPSGGRAQVAEIVNDFVEISRAGLDADDLNEADRAGFDLAALVEYVRVSVQLIFEEFHGQRETDMAAPEPQLRH